MSLLEIGDKCIDICLAGCPMILKVNGAEFYIAGY